MAASSHNGDAGHRDLVVVGASAGGVEALKTLIAGLPGDFPAAVLIVLHLPAGSHSALPNILARAGRLPVRQATAQDVLRAGQILVAPPDHHLIVYDSKVTLSRGPRENGHRPAVDVLFRSAARARGNRVIGIVLSGTLDDGTAGLAALRGRGGLGVVQTPADALHSGMPRSAIAGAEPEHVLPVADMPELLIKLVQEEVPAMSEIPPPPLMDVETHIAALDGEALSDVDRPGEPAGLSCPECSGPLYRIEDGRIVRFRCRVGHAWSMDSLIAQQATAMESALWMAMRALEERAALTQDMSERAGEHGHDRTAAAFHQESVEVTTSALLLRDLIARLTFAEHNASDEEEEEVS